LVGALGNCWKTRLARYRAVTSRVAHDRGEGAPSRAQARVAELPISADAPLTRTTDITRSLSVQSEPVANLQDRTSV